MKDKYFPLVQKIRNRKMFFFLSYLLGLIFLVLFVRNLLVSFILAFVIYFLLAPIVDHLERRKLSRLYATLVPFGFILACLGIFLPLFMPDLIAQFESLRSDFPKYIEGISGLVNGIQNKLSSAVSSIYTVNMAEAVHAKMTEMAENLVKEIPEHVSNSLTVLFLSPFLAFFMLLDGRQMTRTMLSLVPNHFFELALNLNYQITTQMGGFIRARLLESAIVGFVIWVGLMMIGFPYTIVLAVVGGLLNLIPYLGPIIGAVPAFLIALINGVSPQEYLQLCAVYAAAQIVDIVFIVPFVVAKIVDLHPVVVVLAVIVGAQVMGILGMIISIPLASTLKVTFSAVYRHVTEFRD